MAKSRTFFSNGVSRAKVDKHSAISSIRNTTSLDRYLGFPIMKGRAKKADFQFVIEKMKTRLASWKNHFLNKARRLALATSVLSSIPNYYMQIFWLPQGVCDEIDRTTRNFIWKRSSNKGVHLVGWDKITMPKKSRGLGVRKAREANTSLLGKLLGDMHQNDYKFWVNLLTKKYVRTGNFLMNDEAKGSGVWNSISKVRSTLKDGYSMRVQAGNVSFWFDKWSSLGPLCQHVFFVDI